MAHNRQDSDLSDISMQTASDHTSSSQHSCDSAVSADFAAEVEALLDDETDHPTVTVVREARKAIEWLEKTEDPRRHLDKLDYAELLHALLECSELCGGKRYTACAIVIYYDESAKDDKNIERLTSLGLAWLSHLLYPFKGNGQSRGINKVPSQAATPTIEQTSQDLVQGLSENRPDSSDFADLLLERDGYKCVATGKWSANDTFKHVPVGTTRTFVARTKGAHILRRAVAVFKADSKQANERDNYNASVSTWDIIRHYGALSEEVIQHLEHIDAPENGITLEGDIHEFFDEFLWCLVPKEEESDTRVWKTKQFATIDLELKDEVIFSDASVRAQTRSSKATYGIPLPNPHFIRLHAAICHVFNMCAAAGEVLDGYIRKYEKPDSHGVRTAQDFLTWLAVSDMGIATAA